MNVQKSVLRRVALASVISVLAACAQGSSTETPLDAADTDADATVTVDSTLDADDLVAADTTDAAGDASDGPRTCTTNADCGETAVCDTAASRCVQCLAASDTCPASQHCVDVTHTCVPGCRSDEGCGTSGDAGVDASDTGPARASRCETTSHSCVECTADSHCPAGSVCVGNVCTIGCTDTQPCPSGQSCCSGACVDPQTNLAHCGRCDNRCMAPNASPACMNGMCGVGMCTVPYGDCDRAPANGCEANTFTDTAHCGACGTACATRPNANTTCAAGRCEYACAAGFDDCDGNPANGCEVNLLADPTHCGSCSTVCMPPNAVAACVMGRCAIASCATSFGDCDMNATNGCESDLRVSVSHCAMCGRACPSRPNAFPGCLDAMCVTSCVTGFSDCDFDGTNGCEVDVRVSASNCGSCGRACVTPNATPACEGARCRVASCSAGYADCDGLADTGCEVDTRSDPTNCASCGTRCPVLAHQVATCSASRCSAACEAGFVDLDRVAGNGCECNTADADDPDLTFRDTNCDGIDGTIRLAVFVSTRGNDSNPGTMAAPRRSIQSGITLAASSSPRRSVYVARGAYVESITLVSGVSVYGGYDDTAGWSRAMNATTTLTGSTTTAITAQNIVSPIEVQLLTVTSADATTATTSSYGIRAVNSPALIMVRACSITAGYGAAGGNGGSGTTGPAGFRGGDAGRPTAGGVGFSECGANGGGGGAGVSGGGNNGNRGGDGAAVFAGGSNGRGGSGGRAGGGCCSTTYAQAAPADNTGGSSGSNGGNGGASPVVGGLRSDNGMYDVPSGGGGSNGNAGGGGGGGGSGGGDGSGCPFSCGNDTSGGGGGGGGGGCGGTAGRGGTGGGGSFAVASTSSNVQLEDTQLRTRDGGRGGNGGSGGTGGPGGGGGNGGGGGGSAGAGRAGLGGGNGGAAGSGAGGAGGASVCVLYTGTAPSTRGGTCTLGSAGAGGTGGSNGVLGAAPSGSTGVAVAQRTAP